MALTQELLQADASLSGLPEEQISAIVTLSTNDENTVIGSRIGELHGRYDTDILEASGVAKNQGEKSYDYVKRVIADLVKSGGSATELNNQITSLKTEIEGYKETIAKGKGSEVIAQQLKDAQDRMAQIQSAYDADKDKWGKERTDYEDHIKGTRLEYAVADATKGLKFKAGYPESVQNTLLTAAKNSILAKFTPEFQENKLVFRDSEGKIATNQANRLEPFTLAELMKVELKDVLDAGRKVPGAGTSPDDTDNLEILDLSAANTQVKADDIISKHLLAKGLTRGSREFSEEQTKMRKENGVDKLPLR